MTEIIVALEKVHSKNVMYRDLKPENVLIDVDGHIKVSDFGLSKQTKKRDEMSYTFCGSPEYLPPEMICGQKHTRAVDFYTLGCLLYELMFGFPPFHGVNKAYLYKRIISGKVRFPKPIDENAQDLIQWLLSKDPKDRPKDFSDIKKHAFFSNVHWGRVSKKEAIPPWIPDLYTCHVPKKFTQIPLKHVFHKNNLVQLSRRVSHDQYGKEVGDLLKGVLPHDPNSNRQQVAKDEGFEETLEEMLNLEGNHDSFVWSTSENV